MSLVTTSGRDKKFPNAVDLFAGVGGLSAGFAAAGVRILAAIEGDPETAKVYERAHSRHRHKTVVVRADIREVDPKALLRRLQLKKGELTYLIGGPPCQGFSSIGKRQRRDARNKLLLEFPRFLRVLQSDAFLIENVPGLLESHGRPLLDRLLNECVDAGYGDVSYQTVDAAAAGVPQKRVRVVIYGSRHGCQPDLSGLLDAEKSTSSWEALRDLPSPLEAALKYSPGERIPYGATGPSPYALSLRRRNRLVSRWEPVAHAATTETRYAAVEPGGVEPATRCWRLDPEGPCRTLRAGSRSRTACRPIHPFEPRVITVREAARLHSFPDSYPLPAATSSAHVAIGNAVPPLLARAIARQLNAVATV